MSRCLNSFTRAREARKVVHMSRVASPGSRRQAALPKHTGVARAETTPLLSSTKVAENLPSLGQKLPRGFYERSALEVAPALLGMLLVRMGPHGRCVTRIVETEAYQGPDDRAAHSHGSRRTARTEVMFGPAGHAYVYLIYGMWNCLNVVTAAPGVPHAVLIRAAEPIENVKSPTHGPGLLCRALAIDRSHTGIDLLGSEVFLLRPETDLRRPPEIVTSPRVGVDYAGAWAELPWRFSDARSPYVSRLSTADRKRRSEVLMKRSGDAK